MSETAGKQPGTVSRKDGEAGGSGNGCIDLGVIAGAAGYLLKRAQMAVFTEFNRNFAVEDIRPAQFSILVTIENNPGLKQSQVSAALGIKRTNFVPLLDTLEARGLVIRQQAAGDRRSYALHLTPVGAELTQKLRVKWEEHETKVMACIGPENRETFAKWLRAIAAGIGQSDDVADPDEVETEQAAATRRTRRTPASPAPRRKAAAGK